MPSVTLVEISLSTFRLPFLEMWLMLLATSKCLQMYRNDFQYHVNDIICSEHPPSSDCFDEKHTPSSSSPPLSAPPPSNKETNREPNKPVAVPLQCSHPHPTLCQDGEIIGIVYPVPTQLPTAATTAQPQPPLLHPQHQNPTHARLPSSSPPPPFFFFSSTK